MEETMKVLLGTAAVVAGMMFLASYAYANPSISCSCTILDRNGGRTSFSGSSVEHVEITRTESGNVNANCKVDLPSGTQKTWDFNNTGFSCFIDGVGTRDWQEVISANGQTTLTCKIH